RAAARSRDLLARAGGEGVCRDGELLRQVAGPEHLHVGLGVLEQALLDHRLDVDSVPVGEDAVEIAQVDGLRRRPERPDRHRVGRGVTAELRRAHVERHLAALETGRHLLRAGAGLLPLDPSAGITAFARAQATADPLAVLPLLCRLECVEVELFGHYAPSTLTR